MFCTKCGKEQLNNAKFCSSCGVQITNTLKTDTPKEAANQTNTEKMEEKINKISPGSSTPTAKKPSIFKRKFISWKSWLITSIVLWILNLLMAGSIIDNVIQAVNTIPMLIAMIYIFSGIFEKNRNILLNKGKEYFLTGISLLILHSIIYNMSGNNSAIKQVVYATNGIMGILTLLLIISGIICFISGYNLPKNNK